MQYMLIDVKQPHPRQEKNSPAGNYLWIKVAYQIS